MTPEELLAGLEQLLRRAERASLDEWLTVDHVAKILKVSKRWIYDNAHDLPWLKRVNDRLWRVSRHELQRWMASRA